MGLFLVFFLILIQPAHAYLDPGSGSVLVSIIAALAAAAFYFLKSFFYEKARFLFKKQSPVHKQRYGLVFYSEGGQYWHVFLPILRELSARGRACTYFTSDEQDPGLAAELDHVQAVYIGQGHEAYYVLNRLSADVVVMTTPGLDVLQLKRSKNVRHYCHIVHGLEDTSTYPPYGVDNYDSVLVNGRHQLDVIRELEVARGASPKRVEIVGSTYLDIMREQLEQSTSETLDVLPDRNTILLAPSWGDKGFLRNYGESLVKSLIDQDLNVIVRPHPQSYTSEAELLQKLKDAFAGTQALIWDENIHGLEAMQKSDLMLSDFSGIIFDYIFLFQKPVIVTDFRIDPRKFDMNALSSKSSTLMRLIKDEKIGYQLKESDHSRVGEIVQHVLHSEHYTAHIEELKDTVWWYPGESGRRAADVFQELSGAEPEQSSVRTSTVQ